MPPYKVSSWTMARKIGFLVKYFPKTSERNSNHLLTSTLHGLKLQEDALNIRYHMAQLLSAVNQGSLKKQIILLSQPFVNIFQM